MKLQEDTICALATAPGGAIGVIRVSGKEAFSITDRFFSKKTIEQESHTLHFGVFKDSEGKIIDEILISVMHEGKSYTGEASVEISCHASNYIQQQILRTLVLGGCRLAEAGEFTMRAFLNGKMDLSQAEAVADLIASESQHAHQLALNQMRGHFSSELKELREQLIHFASMVELELDFAEEDVEFADRGELRKLLGKVLDYIHKLIQSFELGNAIKHGIPVAIVGPPNTGKSTLLNQLLGEERAIVSDIAGTTRDTIEESINIDGIRFRLIDTAGIREEAEAIESIGIERSKQKIEQAKIVLVLVDVQQNEENILEVMRWARQLLEQFPQKKIFLIQNKTDVPFDQRAIDFQGITLHISAKTGAGIEELKQHLGESVLGEQSLEDRSIVSNARHLEALEKAKESLQRASDGIEQGISGDFIAMDIRQAMYHIGSITGDISNEDLLGNIFSKFCIGK
ncbi:MAG: tRNA uridine-5-carboxymethylaminomethyl(34) synthesis GTPase MnmE [Bacteroidetes bacterium]|nr:MAG: tRNA uridine-5-carboxymethylaminomethyl(34) synthesis GTPase MnmE [Bacteroidota bacterium]